MKPICPDCGDRHWTFQGHVWRATNKEIATNTSATNKFPGPQLPLVERNRSPKARTRQVSAVVEDAGATKAGGQGKTANRRAREAYNAYQREWMRRKRAGLKSKASTTNLQEPSATSS